MAGRGLAVARWGSGALSMGMASFSPVSRRAGAAPAGKAAEQAETDADRLAVVRAGIQVLEGHAAVLELAVGQDT